MKETDACGAAFQFAEPAWLPLIVHVPRVRSVAVVPETVQTEGVVLDSTTVRPAFVVAEIVGVDVSGCDKMEPNDIVWLPFTILKDCATCVAGLYVTLPAWLALIVQVPTETGVTVVPLTVHTEVVPLVKATASPEDALALTVIGVPNGRDVRAPKVIVWFTRVTVTER